MKNLFSLLLLTSLLVCQAYAQERSTGSTSQGSAAATVQNALAGSAQSNLSSYLANNVNQSCAGHAQGSTWTQSCQTGWSGTGVTYTCVNGAAAIKSFACRQSLDCGSSPNGTTKTVACGNGMTGNYSLTCSNGSWLVDPTKSTCARSQCDKQSYTVACPTPIDGKVITGNVNFTCASNVLTMASNNCTSNLLPCSGHASGSSWTDACPSGLTGSMQTSCSDGNALVTDGMQNCTNSHGVPTLGTINVSIPLTCTGAAAKNSTCTVTVPLANYVSSSILNAPQFLTMALTHVSTLASGASAAANITVTDNLANFQNYSKTTQPAQSISTQHCTTTSGGKGSSPVTTCSTSVTYNYPYSSVTSISGNVLTITNTGTTSTVAAQVNSIQLTGYYISY